MKRTLAVVVALVLVLGAALFLWKRGGGGDRPTDGEPVARPTPAVPPQRAPLSGEQQLDLLQNLQVDPDDDPLGALRLEGQVVDDLEQGVPGATVWISANPNRTTTTEADGSFHFEQLIAKTYYLHARADDQVGGPVQISLTSEPAPVIIRVRKGAALEVTVVDDAQRPIADASVSLRPDELTERTNADGVAVFRGVGRGMRVLHVAADGYAAVDVLAEVPETADRASERVQLARGAPVAGRVIDSDGKPIAGARVTTRDASALFSLAASRDGATTDADGKFRLGAVAAGTHRFVATHEDFPPGSSEPIQLDGTAEHTGVTIVLEAGVTVAGKVVNDDGTPGTWATVRIGPASWNGFEGFEGVRQVTADERGAFEMKALKRTQVVALATGEDASSESVELDLVQRGDVRDLILTLSLDGVIAGVVVDETGEPVAEAQVAALPDFVAGADFKDLGVRGTHAAATNGAGAFRLTGLPQGKFQVRATRGDLDMREMFIEPGVPAQTGDTDVKVVLRSPGALKGRVQLSSGGAPKAFTVSVGLRTPHPVVDAKGRFAIDGVLSGTHDVTITGHEFTEKVLRDVEVRAGATTDLGTITVERGRLAIGRVVDTTGAPVEGAEVVHARQQLLSDGKKLGGSLGALFDERLGLKRSTTEADGSYRVFGIGDKPSFIAAEHAERGRSLPVNVPGGEQDFAVDLVLQPFGALEGTVTAGGKPVDGASILASPTTAATPIMVQVGAGGAYVMEKLAAGDYQVTAMVQSDGGLGATSASRTVTVAPGKTTRLDISVALGDIKLTVKVGGEGDAVIDAAQVFLFAAGVTYKTGAEINAAYMGAGGESTQRMAFQMGDRHAAFAQLEAGSYSVCIIPITGDMRDPQFAQRLQRNVATLPVHCRPVTVTSEPKEQTFEAKVPAMPPLPE